jgi:hypothetical protein
MFEKLLCDLKDRESFDSSDFVDGKKAAVRPLLLVVPMLTRFSC